MILYMIISMKGSFLQKLLIVDNSNIIITVLKELFLKNNDFKIYTARSFEDAKQLIKKNTFFAAISNIVLPGALNGELLELLKDNNVPTVVLTSKIDDVLIKTMRKLQVVDYLTKNSSYELESAYNLINILNYIKGLEVLVVEDSLVIAQQIKSTLESLLLTVHIAKNGLEALEVLDNNKNISLIVTDYLMDEMNGLELIKSIKKLKVFEYIPIFVISVDDSNSLKINLFKNGANDFLKKPILEEEFKTKIINIFSNMKHMDDIERFNSILDESVIYSVTDIEGKIKNVSKAFCKISGYSRDELINNSHSIIRHPDMEKSFFKDMWTVLKDGKKWHGEIKNLKKDGNYYWVNTMIEPNFDNKNHMIGYTSIREDITDKKLIYELSITDGLTSLYNRRHFNDITTSIIKDTFRTNKVFAFVLLDIDHFKKYNDTYGHQAGDNALIAVSDSLKNTFKRSNDSIFRLGGEEFGILIKANSKADILLLAHEAIKNIELLNIEHKENSPKSVLTASFGLSIMLVDHNVGLDTIYKKTDDALYKAKNTGRNKIVHFEI